MCNVHCICALQMYTSAPDMSCSGPVPGLGPTVPGQNAMGQFCVRRPQPTGLVGPLLATCEHQHSSLAPSDISDATRRASSNNTNTDGTAAIQDEIPEPKKPLLSGAGETDASDDRSATANFPTMDVDTTSRSFDSKAQEKSCGERGPAAAVSLQSLSRNATTVSFSEIKPRHCNPPLEVRRPVVDIRGHGIDVSTRADLTLRYSSSAQVCPPLPEEDSTGQRLMPLVNVAPLTQHTVVPIDRYAQPALGGMEFARPTVPLAHHHRYHSASVFGSTRGYGQTCTLSYWYGGAMPQAASPYTHARQSDYNPYNVFQNLAVDIPNNRDVPSFQCDVPYKGCQQAVRGFPGLRDSSECDLARAVYDNEQASDIIDDIIDKYHRQMMASYCRKETGDLDCNSTTTSADTCALGDEVTRELDPGLLASVGVESYSSEEDRSRHVNAVDGIDAEATIAGGASIPIRQCSSSCSSPADHTHPMSQASTYDVYSWVSEETNAINCLSDFENSSSEDTRNEQDDIVPACLLPENLTSDAPEDEWS